MQAAAHLKEVVYPARTYAYLLAALLLVLIENRQAQGYILAWTVLLLVYPHVLQWVIRRYADTPARVRLSMQPDALLVGLLVALVDFNLEASVVLVTLLGISVMILGGFRMLLGVLPLLSAGAALGGWLHPSVFQAGDAFYFGAFGALVAYILFVGLLVNEETRRLNRAHENEAGQRTRLEQFRALIVPFLPQQLMQRGHRSPPVRRRLTILFSDIEGFTRLMDAEDEMQVAEMLNAYLTVMSDVAGAYGGTLDKFMGDGVMIFFGDPESAGPAVDARRCVAMALEMRAAFHALSASWRQRYRGEPLHLRIGIHTGWCLVGDFGSQVRRDYTALGSAVNLASRLEGAALRDEILVSAETRQLVSPGVRCRCRGHIALKGVAAPVAVYAVQGLDNAVAAAAPVRLLN